jgi:hypothetical protein
MITELTALEEFAGFGEDRKLIGVTKKVKYIDKLAAIEKLAKHLGMYEKDNFQKKTEINIVSAMSTEELILRANAIKEISNAKT